MRFSDEKCGDLPQYASTSGSRAVADGGLQLGSQFFRTGGNHGRRQCCKENALVSIHSFAPRLLKYAILMMIFGAIVPREPAEKISKFGSSDVAWAARAESPLAIIQEHFSVVAVSVDGKLIGSGMGGDAFEPGLTPKIFRFSDIDEFRSSVRNLSVDFTPLVRTISAEQTILNLEGCSVNFTKSFPRITDARLAPDCTAIGFTMDDGVPIRFNGVERDKSVIVIGGSGAAFNAVERTDRQYASIVFTPEITDRGWPEVTANFNMFETSPTSQQRHCPRWPTRCAATKRAPCSTKPSLAVKSTRACASPHYAP